MSIDVRPDIVPLVRRWLQEGVSHDNIKSSVRVDCVREMSGGLKSPLVGFVDVSAKVVIKQGNEELFLHKKLMNGVNRVAAKSGSRQVQLRVFPEVMYVEALKEELELASHLMIQQAFVKYQPVQELMYEKRTARKRILNAVDLGSKSLGFIHGIKPDSDEPLFADLPRTPDPFSTRIIDRLSKLRREFTWLDVAFSDGTEVNGVKVAPLKSLLSDLKRWQKLRCSDLELSLVHGDPHIANLMVRQRGAAQSARWIDPNPLLGFSDIAYDWGKMLHFVEHVGWAKAYPRSVCLHRRGTKIKATISAKSKSNEITRSEAEQLIRKKALRALSGRENPEACLALAIASAHVGYAAIEPSSDLSRKELRALNRGREFALTLVLKSLGDWNKAVQK